MKNKHLLMATAAITLGMAGVFVPMRAANAQEMGSLPFYGLTSDEMDRDYFKWKLFLENQNREPCQHYLEAPPGFMFDGCRVVRIAPKVAYLPPVTYIEPAAGPVPLLNSSYTLYFDFDRDNVRASEVSMLNKAVEDIKQYHPQTVVVSGHTDAAGSDSYNDDLSQRRARSIENALIAHGISSSIIIEDKAFGEQSLAVPTADGVALQENRRVVIDFQH